MNELSEFYVDEKGRMATDDPTVTMYPVGLISMVNTVSQEPELLWLVETIFND